MNSFHLIYMELNYNYKIYILLKKSSFEKLSLWFPVIRAAGRYDRMS